jgi:hypothetical protein
VRYGRLLFIPLRPAGLITLIALSVVLTASLMVGLAGVPLIVILLSWFFRYSFAFLDRLSGGNTDAPILSVEMIVGSMGEFRWLVPLILVVIAFFVSGAGSFLLGAVVGAVAALGLLVCLPAVLAIQGWTGRLSHSLNPRSWRIALESFGSDYAWMVGWTIFIAVLCLGGPSMIDGMPRMLRIALFLYAWLAIVAVTGGALFTNRERLSENLPLVLRELKARSLEDLAKEREEWLDSIYAAWRANAVENAFRSVMQRVEHSAEPLQELSWLSSRLSTWEPPQFSSRIARELISRLLKDDREGEALRVVRERRSVDPAFKLQNNDETSRLARCATQWGDRDLAAALLRDSSRAE